MTTHRCRCGKEIPTDQVYCNRTCYGMAFEATRAERFWAKAAKGPGCWIWTGALRPGPRAYGLFGTVGKTKDYAHRWAWTLANGKPIPPGAVIRHTCDNPPCVNPDHLVIGTNDDNMADAKERGRMVRGRYMITNPKMTEGQVRLIRRLAAEGTTQRSLAKRFGLHATTVSDIVCRRTWPGVT